MPCKAHCRVIKAPRRGPAPLLLEPLPPPLPSLRRRNRHGSDTGTQPTHIATFPSKSCRIPLEISILRQTAMAGRLLRLVLTDGEGRRRVIAFLHHHGGALRLSLRVLDREGAPRLVVAVLVRRDGTGQLAVLVLDRSGPRRLIVVTVGAPGGFPALSSTMEEVALTLARPAIDPIRGGGLLRAELTVDGWLLLLRLLGTVAGGFYGDMGFGAAPAGGFDGRRMFGHAAVVGLDAPPRFPLIDLGGGLLRAHLTLDGWLLRAAEGGIGLMRFRAAPADPSLGGHDGLLRWLAAAAVGLPLPAAVLGVDEPPRFLPAPPVAADLSAAFGLDGRVDEPPQFLPAPPVAAELSALVPPLPAAPLPLVHPHPATATPLGVLFPRPRILFPRRLDGEELRRVEEGRLNIGPDQPQPNSTQALVSMLLDIAASMESLPHNLDDEAIAEAVIALMTEIVSHMSDRARNQIISAQPFSRMHQEGPPQQDQTNPGRMWMSFFATVGLSVLSNMALYFLSVLVRTLDRSGEGANSMQCAEAEAEAPNPQQDEWNGWVMKFIAWLVESLGTGSTQHIGLLG